MKADKKTLFIFDLDGLLVNTERIYKEGWQVGLQKYHLDVPQEVLDSWAGKSLHDSHAYLMELCHEEALCKQIRQAREDYIYQCLEEGTLTPKPYANEALRYVKQCGAHTALATSSLKQRSTTILRHLGLYNDIDIPVFAEDVQQLKPWPDLYIEVLARARCSKQEAIAFEDSLTGYKAATAAGIETILIPDKPFFKGAVPSHMTTAEDLSIVFTLL